MSSSHVRSEAAGDKDNYAQLGVELIDHLVAVEHVRRPLDVRVVLWCLYHIVQVTELHGGSKQKSTTAQNATSQQVTESR